jgi:hypothetical protein
MRTFFWVSGERTEVQRFVNVPMRLYEQYPARERRRLRSQSTWGLVVKLVVHARVMPARRGHRVPAVLHRRQVVGLRNLTTGAQVNFARSDLPPPWRRCDGIAPFWPWSRWLLAWRWPTCPWQRSPGSAPQCRACRCLLAHA